jgi:hypothetical protein
VDEKIASPTALCIYRKKRAVRAAPAAAQVESFATINAVNNY